MNRIQTCFLKKMNKIKTTKTIKTNQGNKKVECENRSEKKKDIIMVHEFIKEK